MRSRKAVLKAQIESMRKLHNMAVHLGFTDDAQHWIEQENEARRELAEIERYEEEDNND